MKKPINHLGNLEQQIMDILWKHHPYSTREVLDSLPTNKAHAYTTIATILLRLCEKRLLVRKETNNGYVYSPKLTKMDYGGKVVKSFLNSFVDSFGDTAIVSFAQSIDTLPTEKRLRLLKLLQKDDKNK